MVLLADAGLLVARGLLVMSGAEVSELKVGLSHAPHCCQFALLLPLLLLEAFA